MLIVRSNSGASIVGSYSYSCHRSRFTRGIIDTHEGCRQCSLINDRQTDRPTDRNEQHHTVTYCNHTLIGSQITTIFSLGKCHTSLQRDSILFRTLDSLKKCIFNRDEKKIDSLYRIMSYKYDDDGSALYHGEYRPLPQEFLAIGIFGIFLYSGILMASAYLLIYHTKTILNKMFYISMMTMAIFELPRLFLIAITGSYHSTTGYAMHVISGIFYFICLAIIGINFANILELGSLSGMIYSKRGLSLAVLIHTLVDITSVIICLRINTLAKFFSSDYYLFFIIFDICQNLLYSVTLVFFGLRLIYR